ncbi:MAG: hypothetical protein ABI824_00750 [Acidobacteriota bacterium]
MNTKRISICIAAICLILPNGYAKDRKKDDDGKAASLWATPDIESRDLFYGSGGNAGAPGSGPFEFVEEDKGGNSPKFVVRDPKGDKWKVKVGAEAKPETVVTRFVWAVGYAVDDDYLLPSQQVLHMPKKLSRGGEFVSSDGTVRDARWERMGKKKRAEWRWRKNPFSGTRELNGLRVLMAMFNNYDMKDSQNSIYDRSSGEVYAVSDLGATLGSTSSRWPSRSPRGDLSVYSKSDFIKKVTADYVDFAAPSWPLMFGFLPMPPLPYSVITYPVKLFGAAPSPNVQSERWIGKRVPRKDVEWVAGLLARLSRDQIHSAFRAADYSPDQIDGFTQEVQRRIDALNALSTHESLASKLRQRKDLLILETPNVETNRKGNQ